MKLPWRHHISTCFVSLPILATALSSTRHPLNISNSGARCTVLLKSASKYDGDNRILIRDMITGMASFFGTMIDSESSRFYALCFPPSGKRAHQHNPIRDLAAAWDASKALRFFNERGETIPQHAHLWTAICTTVREYETSLKTLNKNVPNSPIILDSEILKEPVNIAHSALMILASTCAMELSVLLDSTMDVSSSVDGLTRGILMMQRQDGAFCVNFGQGEGDNNVYRGIEFYPGEAMVSLMHAFEKSATLPHLLNDMTKQAIVPAMERAFGFYSAYYHHGNTDINYNIWQAQAFSKLFFAFMDKDDRSRARAVAKFVVDLCEDVINSKSWKYELARGRSFYPNLNTVEIACGLDALADGIHVARMAQDERLEVLERHASNAITFLQWIQDQVPKDVTIGHGGLGYGGAVVLEQRLDVTGHAISALTKLDSLKCQ